MLATVLAVAEGVETEITNPILPVFPEIFWGAVFFFALWMLMRYVLLPPVLNVMDEREERVRAARAEAETAVTGADEAKARYDARIAEARAEANALLTASREEADRYRAGRIAEVSTEINALRDQAAAEVAEAKAAALAELRGQVAAVAVAAASRVVQRNLELERQLQVIEDYVNRAGADGSRG